MPLELDLLDGRAFVSLVAFTQAGLRPAIAGRIGALLARPLATHEFLNVRTYVRHRNVHGIYFIAEWIPNRLAALVGPRTYGLPYRLGRLRYDVSPDHGTLEASIVAGDLIAFRCTSDPLAAGQTAPPGSRDAFLLERYIAFTCRRGRIRRFDVAHEPWPYRPASVEFADLSLLNSLGTWTAGLHPICSHFSPGVRGVGISGPGAGGISS